MYFTFIFSFNFVSHVDVDKKKISGSKKGIENFIQAKYRIIPQEQHLRNFWELLRPLQVKAQLYKFFEVEGCTLNDVIIDSLHSPDLSLLMAS